MLNTYAKNFKYSYEGPVLEFDRVIAHRWTASTIAVNEKKARSNLAYQFKKQFNKASNAKITLPGKIIRDDGEEKIS